MRNRALRGCLIGLAIIFCSSLASPKEMKRETTEKPKDQGPTNKQEDSAKPPIIVNIAPPEKTKEEIAQQAKESADKAELDRNLVKLTGDLADYTFWLAIATGALVITSAGLLYLGRQQSDDMKASLGAAEKSAAAAEKSAKVAEDALTVLERPCVFIDRKISLVNGVQETKHFTASNPAVNSHFAVEYFIANHGRTPAIIKNITACLVVISGIPGNRRIVATEQIPSAIAIVKGVPKGPLMCISAEPATESGCDEILSGQKFLFFYGQIMYRDIFSYDYATGFGWRYFPKANIWNPAGGNDYNFHIRVSPEPMKQAPFRF
jgi:hypothetical protein